MELFYSNKLSKKLKSDSTIVRQFGKAADNVILCISILEGADNLKLVPNVPPTRRHKLSGNLKGYWAIDVTKNYRLIFKPMDDEEDLEKIEKIFLEDIVDYH